MHGNVKDITSRQYARWKVLRRGRNDKHGLTRWHCRCKCGVTKLVLGLNLRKGTSKSCGCLLKDLVTKHGHTTFKSRAYHSWEDMRGRCLNKKSIQYKDYGGRGIKICKRWNSFSNFFKDLGAPPEKTVLDRIDNSKGYYPSNCRWATYKISNRNTRRNILLTFRGVTKCRTDWAYEMGLLPTCVKARMRKGWSVKKALTTPAAPRIKRN